MRACLCVCVCARVRACVERDSVGWNITKSLLHLYNIFFIRSLLSQICDPFTRFLGSMQIAAIYSINLNNQCVNVTGSNLLTLLCFWYVLVLYPVVFVCPLALTTAPQHPGRTGVLLPAFLFFPFWWLTRSVWRGQVYRESGANWMRYVRLRTAPLP